MTYLVFYRVNFLPGILPPIIFPRLALPFVLPLVPPVIREIRCVKCVRGINPHYAGAFPCYLNYISSVVHILDDERYTGSYIIGKRDVTEVGGHRVRMKDESQWIKKNARAYPLRGKVFFGCCGHAMPRVAKKNAAFFCRYTKVNESADCHGPTGTGAGPEGMLYEILSKQAQVIFNVADLANVGQLDIQIAQQAECDKQIEGCLDQKRVLYEQLVLKQITGLQESESHC